MTTAAEKAAAEAKAAQEKKDAEAKAAQDKAVAAKAAEDKAASVQHNTVAPNAPKPDEAVDHTRSLANAAPNHAADHQASVDRASGLGSSAALGENDPISSGRPSMENRLGTAPAPLPTTTKERDYRPFHSGPYDHLLDAIGPGLRSFEHIHVVLDERGTPRGAQRERPPVGVPHVRCRVNDLFKNTVHHLTTETGADLSSCMQPDPDGRVEGENSPPSIHEVLREREAQEGVREGSESTVAAIADAKAQEAAIRT